MNEHSVILVLGLIHIIYCCTVTSMTFYYNCDAFVPQRIFVMNFVTNSGIL